MMISNKKFTIILCIIMTATIIASGCTHIANKHNVTDGNLTYSSTYRISDPETPLPVSANTSLTVITKSTITVPPSNSLHNRENGSIVATAGTISPPESPESLIVRKFMGSQPPRNLTFLNLADANLTVLISDNAIFLVSTTTNRVQAADWTGTGPQVLSGIVDENRICEIANQFAKEKYPELWNANTSQEWILNSSCPYPSNPEKEYFCQWSETTYFQGKNINGQMRKGGQVKISIVLDLGTGKLRSYEETYPFTILPKSSLIPTLSDAQTWIIAEKIFKQNGIIDIQPSERKSTRLYLSNPDLGPRHLVWSFEVEQLKPAVYGGLVGIDAHDGSALYYSLF